MAEQEPLNYAPVSKPLSRLAVAAIIWLILIAPVAFALWHWVFQSRWFLLHYWTFYTPYTTTTAPASISWITLLSPNQWLLAALLLFEFVGFLLGTLARREIRIHKLRGRGMAMNAQFIPIFMAMITVMAYGVLHMPDIGPP